MNYPLELYDKAFKVLVEHYPDRNYPYPFNSLDEIVFDGETVLTDLDNLIISEYWKCPVFSFNGNNNSFSINFKRSNLSRAYTGNLVLSSPAFRNLTDGLKFNVKLSEYKNGELAVYDDDFEVIPVREVVKLVLNQPTVNQSDSSRNLQMLNISNITVTVDDSIVGDVKLENLEFLNKNAKLTLEDMDLYIAESYEELNNYYGLEELPKKLDYLVARFAGANAWIGIHNEDNANPANDNITRNYGTNIRKEVFKAIDDYKGQSDKRHNNLPSMKAIRFERT
ncbi:MAG: hypothetical protein LBU40_04110 [Methanobrevibacter sp.]|jgi:hypothetical protein|nr:hypothetical protein [Methanobrevibacter sp.]